MLGLLFYMSQNGFYDFGVRAVDGERNLRDLLNRLDAPFEPICFFPLNIPALTSIWSAPASGCALASLWINLVCLDEMAWAMHFGEALILSAIMSMGTILIQNLLKPGARTVPIKRALSEVNCILA